MGTPGARIWHQNYPPATPTEITFDPAETLLTVLAQGVAKFGAKPAFAHWNTRITYSMLDDLSTHFAAYLQDDLGLQQGDHIALMLPNILPHPVSVFGSFKAGMTVVNVDPACKPRELRHQLRDCEAVAIVVVDAATTPLAEVIDDTEIRHVVVTARDDLLDQPWPDPTAELHQRFSAAARFSKALSEGQELTLKPVAVTGEQLAFIQYTGGTTGFSKRVMITHSNAVANNTQMLALLADTFQQGDVMVTVLPIYHAMGLVGLCLLSMRLGGMCLLITDRRDFEGTVEQLKPWRFNVMAAVNPLLIGWMNTPGFADLDFSGLRMTWTAGMRTPKPTADRYLEITGCMVAEGYGLTEATVGVCGMPSTVKSYNGSLGVPSPSTDMVMRDHEGNDVSLGEPGEVCLKGPQMTQGYWKNEAATREAFTPDGYFKTGDIGCFDEHGFFHLVDRKKDMIIVGGGNVYPAEVEMVAAEVDGIQECGCVGIPDKVTGEAVVLFVTKSPRREVSVEQILDHCRANLQDYKVPTQIAFIDALPRSPVGKVLRRELKELAKRQFQ